MHVIEVLSTEEAGDLRRRVEALPFVDGRSTARGDARQVKQNSQTAAGDAATSSLVTEITDLLDRSPALRQTAFPRAFVGTRLSRFVAGDRYGMHVDAAVMGRGRHAHRTDLSFTLFLSEPDQYEGGELRVASGAAAPPVKLPAGHLALYPTGQPHEVTTVRAGERLACVGWIESWIADPELRGLIVKLGVADALLTDEGCGPVPRMLLSEVREGLVRYGSR